MGSLSDSPHPFFLLLFCSERGTWQSPWSPNPTLCSRLLIWGRTEIKSLTGTQAAPARDDTDSGSLPSWVFWEDRRAWLFTPETVVSRGWFIYGYPKSKANWLLFFQEYLILEKKWSTSKYDCKIKINWCLIEYVHNVTSCQLVKFKSSQLLWSYM